MPSSHDVEQPEHRVDAQEAEEIVDRAQLDVVEHEQPAGGEVPIEVVVVEVGKREAVRAVDQSEVERAREAMRR